MMGQIIFEAEPFEVNWRQHAADHQGRWLRHDDRIVVLLDDDLPWRDQELQEGPVARPANAQLAVPTPTKSKVANTFAVPFRWIAKISIRIDGKDRPDQSGSGVLISDRHVLTAAHVVYDVVQNPARYSLNVTIALDGNKDLGTSVPSKKPDISPKYSPKTLDYDYAVITLSRAIADERPSGLRGDKLCFWGSSQCGAGTTGIPVNPGNLVRQTGYTAGYPRNKGASQMWRFSGMLASVPEQSPIMVYTGETTEGQSGSPLWIQQNRTYNLVGIVVARGNVNRIVRLTWDVVEQVNDWMLAAEKEVSERQLERHRL